MWTDVAVSVTQLNVLVGALKIENGGPENAGPTRTYMSGKCKTK